MNHLIIDSLVFLYLVSMFILRHMESKYKRNLPLDIMWEIGVIAFILVWLIGR
ncbi:hypothetical protein [Thermococcus sp.]